MIDHPRFSSYLQLRDNLLGHPRVLLRAARASRWRGAHAHGAAGGARRGVSRPEVAVLPVHVGVHHAGVVGRSIHHPRKKQFVVVALICGRCHVLGLSLLCPRISFLPRNNFRISGNVAKMLRSLFALHLTWGSFYLGSPPCNDTKVIVGWRRELGGKISPSKSSFLLLPRPFFSSQPFLPFASE